MNSEGFRETLSERQKKAKKAKMAGGEEAARGAEGPRDDLRSEIGRRKTESYLETTGDDLGLCITGRESKAGRA
jgi:hypothetical protein